MSAKINSWLKCVVMGAIFIVGTGNAVQAPITPPNPSVIPEPVKLATLYPWKYQTIDQWEVEYLTHDAKGVDFAYCQVTKIYASETALRFTLDDKQFTMDFMGEASGALGDTFPVTYAVDRIPQQRANAKLVTDPEGVEWARITESTAEPSSGDDALINGKRFIIKSGKQQWRYSLAQSKRALNSMFKCHNESGLHAKAKSGAK